MSVSSSTISELFTRDPLTLTNDDISQIIAYYREARTKFNLENKGTKPPKAKTEKATVLDISDLDI